MKEVAKYSENGYFLTHSWYIDDVGFKRNSFEVYTVREDGMKVIYPFHNHNKSTQLLGDDISPCENFEYADMLREQVNRITQNEKRIKNL